ncbi:hypothetical protein DFH06DRAFT_1139049 [Mycena polygramma]|nr:hypothetical protein DFH06DRAFT_1139049 [Mycena polygramma]
MSTFVEVIIEIHDFLAILEGIKVNVLIEQRPAVKCIIGQSRRLRRRGVWQEEQANLCNQTNKCARKNSQMMTKLSSKVAMTRGLGGENNALSNKRKRKEADDRMSKQADEFHKRTQEAALNTNQQVQKRECMANHIVTYVICYDQRTPSPFCHAEPAPQHQQKRSTLLLQVALVENPSRWHQGASHGHACGVIIMLRTSCVCSFLSTRPQTSDPNPKSAGLGCSRLGTRRTGVGIGTDANIGMRYECLRRRLRVPREYTQAGALVRVHLHLSRRTPRTHNGWCLLGTRVKVDEIPYRTAFIWYGSDIHPTPEGGSYGNTWTLLVGCLEMRVYLSRRGGRWKVQLGPHLVTDGFLLNRAPMACNIAVDEPRGDDVNVNAALDMDMYCAMSFHFDQLSGRHPFSNGGWYMYLFVLEADVYAALHCPHFLIHFSARMWT